MSVFLDLNVAAHDVGGAGAVAAAAVATVTPF